jgi:hypothetical protein
MKKKTAALNNAVSVVRSQKLPATPKPVPWREFNRFVEAADSLEEYVGGLNGIRFKLSDDDGRTSGDVADDAEFCQGLVARVKAGFELFDRPDKYDDEGTLSEAHVAKRLGVMVGAIPTAKPGNPEEFASMLVAHVGAVEGLTVVALESACREILETQKFISIAEVMKVVREHVKHWHSRRSAMLRG